MDKSLGWPGTVRLFFEPGYYVESPITAIEETTITTVIEIGQNQATFQTPSGTIVTEDQFQGGFYQVKDHTGEGHSFPIAGNTAGGKTGATDTIQIYLAVDTPVEIGTTADVQIVTSKWNNLILGTATEASTANNVARGIPPVQVEAEYYFWLQETGPGLGFAGEAITSLAIWGMPLTAADDGKFDLSDTTDLQRPVAMLLDPNTVTLNEAIYIDMCFA